MLSPMTPTSPFQRFMAELRRRHVPQTVAVYAVAAWAAIQFADVVVPNVGWPQWVVTATIIAAGVGLPVVLALAWFLEWGPEGVHRTPDAPAEAPEGGRGRPVEPRSSYAPWAVAVGVLAVGISATLIIAALRSDGDPGAQGGEESRTRSARRQDARGHPVAPVPPRIVSPGFADSIGRFASDSILRSLDSEGFEGIGPLIEMARRIGESGGRAAAGGPVEILEPETWRYGAPQPVHPGDTVFIQGVARAEGGVEAVELDGRVIARRRGEGEELPFETTWVIGQGRGFRKATLVVRPREGEPLERSFAVTIVPRSSLEPGG